MTKPRSYTSDDITFFKNDVEKIQKKPAMYVGDTGKNGFFKVSTEPLDNAVDEFRAGRNKFVGLSIDTKTKEFTVSDLGMGIPVDIHKLAKISTLQHIFTALQSSGKIDSQAYKNAGGTHGIGVTATNALSEYLECWTYRKDAGGWHYIKFKKGEVSTKPEKVSKVPFKQKSGTVIKFKHNQDFFSSTKISKSAYEEWFEITSYLNAGLELSLTIDGKTQTWKSKQGLIDFVMKQLTIAEQTNLCKEVFAFASNPEDKTSIEFAVAFTNTNGISIQCHTNSILNVDKGEHYEVFRKAFHKVLKNYAPKSKFTADDALEGLVGIINFNANDASFNNQAKNRLVDIRPRELSVLVEDSVNQFFIKNRKFAIEWAKRASEIRKKTEAFLDSKIMVKNAKLAKAKLSEKLSDVSGTYPPEKCSIYLVEGDSAGGLAKQARNGDIHAIYPLKGKPLNVMEAKLESVMTNVELATVLTAIGVDVSKLGSKDCLKTLKYHKIIFLADADVDGNHINTLLGGLFYKLVPELIDNGHIYSAILPEFIAKTKNKTFMGSSVSDVKKQMADAKIKNVDAVPIRHLKGLGEMEPEDLEYSAFSDTAQLYQFKPLKRKTRQTLENILIAGIERKKLFGLA